MRSKLIFFFSLVLVLTNCNAENQKVLKAPIKPSKLSITDKEYKLVQDVLPNTNFSNIKRSLVRGLYEVQTGKNIFYVYPHKKLIFFGRIMTNTGKDLTPKIEKFKGEDFKKSIKELDLNRFFENALKTGEKKGDFDFIVIKSPTCPNCYILEKYFDKYNLLTFNLYTNHPLSYKILKDKYNIEKQEPILNNHAELINSVNIDVVPIILVVKDKKEVVEIIEGANLIKLNEYLPNGIKKINLEEFKIFYSKYSDEFHSFYEKAMKELNN